MVPQTARQPHANPASTPRRGLSIGVRPKLGPLGVPWGYPGGPAGPLGGDRAAPTPPDDPTVKPSKNHVNNSKSACLGLPWSPLGVPWGPPAVSWGFPGTPSGPLAVPWGSLGIPAVPRVSPKRSLGIAWSPLDVSWGHLGSPRDPLGVAWGLPRASEGVPRAQNFMMSAVKCILF